MSTLSPPVLEVMDVDFKYPTGPTILRDVNFGLDQSSRVCIVGPNGAGAHQFVLVVVVIVVAVVIFAVVGAVALYA